MEHAGDVFELNGHPDDATSSVERIDGHFSPESRVGILLLSETQLRMQTTEVAALRAPGREYFLAGFLRSRDARRLEEQENRRSNGRFAIASPDHSLCRI